MDINRANMDALFNTYNTAFTAGMQAAGQRVSAEDPTLEEIAMVAPSSGAAAIHAWLDAVPAMREWVGDRHIQNLKSDKLTVVNLPYEATVSVKADDIADDQYGLYTPLIQAMGNNAASLWMELAITALTSNGTWADGVTFFKTDRTYGDQTINNTTTSALAEATFEAAIQAMQSFKASNGQPLEVAPRYIVVGPKLRKTAWDLVVNSLKSAGSSKGGALQNHLQGIVELRVSRRLVGTYDDYWFVLGEQAGIKPVYVQQRKLPMLTRMDAPTDESVFMRNEYRYGTHARGAAFLTLPHLAYGGIVS